MAITVDKETLNQYLNLEISESALFPADAPAGTRLSDLQPEHGDPAVCTLDHVSNLFEKFLDEDITFEQMQAWIASMLDLDLFVFDNSRGDRSMDWMFDTLDRLAGYEDEDTILDKVDFTALMDKAASF